MLKDRRMGLKDKGDRRKEKGERRKDADSTPGVGSTFSFTLLRTR